LIDSLDPKKNRDMVFRAGEGAGASGSFFFFSYDKKFIIKTMNNTELKVFLKLLPEYEQHLTSQRKSLFSRIYGVYTIYMNKVSSVNLILMANTLEFKSKDAV
jgi:1-phosphatidylinositol-4-phosphate 5-kinase